LEEEPELHNYSFGSQSYQQQMPMTSGMMPNSFDLTHASNFDGTFASFGGNSLGDSSLPPASSLYYANPDAERVPDLAKSGYVFLHESNNSKKRKAPEISTSDEPVTTAQAPTSSDAIETANVTDASTNTVATTAAPTEPQPKKRKIKQAHSQRSMLRTAVIEAGKYTAGAIIGGIGLVTILASPIGEALASC
jgi:hypothetical protein